MYCDVLNNVLKRKIFRDIKNNILSGIVSKLGSFILTILIVRILTVEEFGIYIYALSIALVLLSFIDLGIGTAIITFVSRHLDKDIITSRSYFRYFFKISMYVTLITGVILFLFSREMSAFFFRNSESYYFIFSIFLLILTMQVSNIMEALIISLRKFEFLPKIRAVGVVLRIVLLSGLGLVLREMGALIGSILAYALIFLIVINSNEIKRFIFGPIKRIDKRGLKKYLFLLNMSTVSYSIFAWVDSIMIGFLSEFYNVAYYRIAFSLVSAIISVVSISAVFQPRIVGYTMNELKAKLKKIILLAFSISLPAFLLVNLFSLNIIDIVYGVQYRKSLEVIFPLSLLILLNSFDYFNAIFALRKRPIYITYIAIVSSISNFTLNLILIPPFGILGAAWATVVSRIVNIGIGYSLFIKVFKNEG